MQKSLKPLGRKAYGSIGHLPNSRMGPGDHKVPAGYARICTVCPRDEHDLVIVQEKLDGSCVSVGNVNGEFIPLNRAGWPAISSPHLQHRLFHDWALEHISMFYCLRPGERVVGEWLALAHGTKYDLRHDPFVAFDVMVAETRYPFSVFGDYALRGRWTVPHLVNVGPITPEKAIAIAQHDNFHNAIDPIEGVVYRVERNGRVDFLAKWVRPDKVDGKYFGEFNNGNETWNWNPANA